MPFSRPDKFTYSRLDEPVAQPDSPADAPVDISLELLLRNLPGMVYRCLNDDACSMEFVSAGVEELTGYQAEDLLDSRKIRYAELIHAGDREYVRNKIRAAVDARSGFQITYRLIAADGGEKWVWEQGTGVYDEQGVLLALEGYVTDITQSQRAQHALRESEERFRSLVKATTDAVWDYHLKSDKLWWSEGLRPLFGWEPNDFLSGGDAWSDRIHPKDRERVHNSVAAAVEGDAQIWTDEYRFLRKDGSYAHVLDRGFIVRDAAGKAIRIFGGMTDLSDRKKAEEAASRAARNREDILRIQKQVASTDLGLQAAMDLMAGHAMALTGATGGEIELVEEDYLVSYASTGSSSRQVGSRQKIVASLSGKAVGSGTVLRCDDTESEERTGCPFCRANGVRSMIAAPLRAGDRVIGTLTVTSTQLRAFNEADAVNLQILVESLGAVIERHRSEERLRASEEKYRLLFQNNPYPMWVYHADTLRIAAVNQSTVKHYGYSEQEFREMTVLDTHLPADREQLISVLSGLENQPKRRHLWRHVKKDGSLIDVEISSDPIEFDGRPARLVLGIDVTERVRTEQALVRISRAERMLIACNEAVIRRQDEASLLEEICRIVVDIGGYQFAWVGFAQEDEAKSILPVAHFGDHGKFLKNIQLSYSGESPFGQGPAGRTIRGGNAIIVEDLRLEPTFKPWQEIADEIGYRSAVWLPLSSKERTFGVLTLYSAETMHISADEVRLLQALADDLAFGINNIHMENERQRLQMTALKVAAGVSATTGAEFFKQLAANMGEAVGAYAAFVVQLGPGTPGPTTLRTVSAVIDGTEVENIEYEIPGTPCEKVLAETELVLPDNVLQLYPSLPLPGVRAYVGCRLDGSGGRPIGLLYVLFREALKEHEFITSTLRIFAARAAAELERREADARIHEQASLLDKAKDAIVVRGMDNLVRFWNKGAERLYGWSSQEAVGRPVGELLYEDPGILNEAMHKVLKDGEWSGEISERCKDGKMLTVEANWTLVCDENGKPQSIFAIKTDITQRKAAEHEIQYLAFYDPLTKLPNRLLLVERLEHALATSASTKLEGALLFIDLDNFKTLNDTFGHDMGDLLLQQVANRLSACVREGDTVARLGGDEFVVMLENLSDQSADAAARAKSVGEKILSAINQPFRLGSIEHHSTPSIGVTLFDSRQSNVSELLKRADVAMYQAKAAGRNTMRFFDPEMQAAVSARAALEADLRQSLAEQAFFLCYQPQIDDGGCITGVEALVRWRHPQRGMISPADFIPLAEESGLILPLGRWVLETACAQLASWARQPQTAALDMAVNVSARQFRHPDFIEQVMSALDRSGADPRRLTLELTESLLVDDMDVTIAKMTALKAKGVGFSLDDFGTGYSSLFYLKHLPLDLLKIDQSFVRDVLNDPNDAAIVHTIIALGKSLGLAVIAEGVETEEQRLFLAEHGCAAYQGYLFARPMPIEQLETFLLQHTSASSHSG